MKRKLLSAMLSICLVLILVACSGGEQTLTADDTNKEISTTQHNKSEERITTTASSDSTQSASQSSTQKKTTATTAKNTSKTQGVSTVHKHTFADATCQSPKKCKTCGYTEGKALEHSYTEADCKSEKTCTRCGHKSGQKGAHNYRNYVCVKCGEVDKGGINVKMPTLPQQFSIVYEFDDSSSYGMIDYIDYTVVKTEYVLDDSSSAEKPFNVGFKITIRFDGRRREYVGSFFKGKEPLKMTVGEFKLAWVRLQDDLGNTYFDPPGCNLSEIERIAQGYDADMTDGLPFNIGTEFVLAFTFEDLKPGTYTLQFFEGVKAKTYTNITGKDTYDEWTNQ